MNRKRKSLKNKNIYLIVLVFVVVIAILSYTIKTGKKLNTFESLINFVLGFNFNSLSISL